MPGSTFYVFIKLATAKEDEFAVLEAERGLCVGQVAALACASLAWGLTANKVRVHLVAECGEEPSEEAIEAVLATKHLSVSAAVPSGAWLVAVPTTLAGSGGGGGGVGASGGGGDAGAYSVVEELQLG
jgi:hypothetical protein